MKTIKILFCVALLFSSCLSVDHEVRRYNAEGMTCRYGYNFVDNTFRRFYRFCDDGYQYESYKFEQLSDSTWKFSYNHETCCMVGEIVKSEDNDTVTMSFEGYDVSGDYSLHVFTTEDIVCRSYYYNFLAGTVRLEFSKENQSIGWGQLVHKDENYIITTGTE